MPSQLRWMILCMLSGAVVYCITQARAETVELGHPVIRALVLPVQAGTTVEPVSGTVYITRHARKAIHLTANETLQHDDLLQLQGQSSARVRAPGGTELVLTEQHGEWFRFVIDSK
jgi:hypothetical protein